MAGEFGPRPSSDLGHRATWRPAGETLLFPKPALATRARARFRLRWAASGRESRARILVIIIAAAIILSVNLGVAGSASYFSLI